MTKDTKLMVLKPHDFTIKLNSIKAFANDKIGISKLEMYKEKDKIFGFIPVDHPATGRDLNQLVEWTQNELKEVLNASIKIKKEFNTIYDCIKSLDNDYIQAINLNSAKAREIAEDARKNSDKLAQAVKKFQRDYDDLRKNIEPQNKISKSNFIKSFIEKNAWIIIIFLAIIVLSNFVINILFLIGAIK